MEALKEAIRQEVAAITPEMILKLMGNYRERLHKFINIQGRQMRDFIFETHRCKTAFRVLSTNRKLFEVSSLVLNIFAPKIGAFFLTQHVLTHVQYHYTANKDIDTTCAVSFHTHQYILTQHVRQHFTPICKFRTVNMFIS